MGYTKNTRTMTDAERETARREQAKFKHTSPAEREAFYRKLQRNVWAQTVGVTIFASGILLALVLQNSNNKLRDGIIIGILLLLGFGIACYRELSKFALAEKGKFEEEQGEKQWNYNRWEEIIQQNIMWLERIEATRFAKVRPSHDGMATYYFADMGEDGIFCFADKITTPNTILESVTFTEHESNDFDGIGTPLSPIQTLTWSDFTEPEVPDRMYGGHYDYRPPFPAHGMRYALSFSEIKNLLVFLED
jgi:hypothetical protein